MKPPLSWIGQLLSSKYRLYTFLAIFSYTLGLLHSTLFPILFQRVQTNDKVSVRGQGSTTPVERPRSNKLNDNTIYYPPTLTIGPSLKQVLPKVRSIDVLPSIRSMFPEEPPNCTCAWFQFADEDVRFRRLLIISAGGTGTTYLQSMLHNHVSNYGWYINHAIHMDGFNFMWKHAYPADASIYFGPDDDKQNWVQDGLPIDGKIFKLALQCYKPDRIIYLLNEPISALRSLYRRGFQTSTTAVAAGFDVSLEKYRSWDNYTNHVFYVTKTHRDLSGRFQHLVSWLVTDIPCPLLVIDFPTIVKNKELLANYLSVPVEPLLPLEEKVRKSKNLTEYTSIEGYTYKTLYSVLYKQMVLYNLHLRIPIDYQDPIDLWFERSYNSQLQLQQKLWPLQAEDYPYNKTWPKEGILSGNSSVRRCTDEWFINKEWLRMEPTNLSKDWGW